MMTAAPRSTFSIKSPAEDYPRVSWSSLPVTIRDVFPTMTIRDVH